MKLFEVTNYTEGSRLEERPLIGCVRFPRQVVVLTVLGAFLDSTRVNGL